MSLFIRATLRSSKKIELLNVDHIEKMEDADKQGGTLINFASGRHSVYAENLDVLIGRMIAPYNAVGTHVQYSTAQNEGSKNDGQKAERQPGAGYQPTTGNGNPGQPPNQGSGVRRG